MMRWRLALVAAAIVLFSPSLAAAEVAQVDWGDLLPTNYNEVGKDADQLRDRLDALPKDAQAAFYEIGGQRRLKKQMDKDGLTADDLLPINQALLKTDFNSKFPGAVAIADAVDKLNARIDVLDKTPNVDLNGKTVRMAGYVLPLEYDGWDTIEFLLVPFVGACIHVPPPPPNQIVHVKYEAGFKSRGLYAPVYVTGRLLAVGGTLGLTLKGGEAPVETGYRLEAVSIELYKE